MEFEFNLPDIGEGLAEGEVVKWHVKEGDQVKENQPLCNVLTDKAEVEITSPKTGAIARLAAKEGQKVAVHGLLVVFQLDGPGPAKTPAANGHQTAETASAPSAAPAAGGGEALALPAVRKLAAELMVNLSALRGSGPGGRITEADVRAAAAPAMKTLPLQKLAPEPASGAHTPTPGSEEKIPFVGIRRRTAEKMAESKRTAAHVTHVDEADFTAMAALRAELKGEAEKRGVKLSFLPFIIRALVRSLKEFPDLNASLDAEGGFIRRKLYYNLGIATATSTGLLVPNIKNADAKSLWDLAGELNRLAEKARSGKIEVPELQGGTFTITNIGPIGGLMATPIINHPEVAILGLMKIKKAAVVRDGGIHIRDMGNLALSFDHRVVDGAEAAHFMNTLIKHIENPRTLL